MMKRRVHIILGVLLLALPLMGLADANKGEIQHDAEHYMLLQQHGDRWAKEDKEIAAKLEEVRNANGGKRPNILFVLIDDVGFGEMGDPVLNDVRGYETPNINAFARESLTFSRMYSEPTCTPTRTALLTGRLPVRSHMLEPKIVPPEGTGLHKDEVTLAELLKKTGYNPHILASGTRAISSSLCPITRVLIRPASPCITRRRSTS